jgi:hypothetical protein
MIFDSIRFDSIRLNLKRMRVMMTILQDVNNSDIYKYSQNINDSAVLYVLRRLIRNLQYALCSHSQNILHEERYSHA